MSQTDAVHSILLLLQLAQFSVDSLGRTKHELKQSIYYYYTTPDETQ